MPVSNDPVFAVGGRILSGVCTAAKTDLTNATNAVKLGEAGPNGSSITAAWALNRATLVAASVIQLYRSPDEGTTLILLDAVEMKAADAGKGAVDFERFAPDAPMAIDAGDWLYAGSTQALAGGIAVHVAVEDR